MDGDNGSIVGTATDILGVLLLGSTVIYGFFASGWIGLFPKAEHLASLDPRIIGGIIFISALIVGYAVQGIGFPLAEWIFRKKLKYHPAKDLLRPETEYSQNFWGKLCGRPHEFGQTFRTTLVQAIDNYTLSQQYKVWLAAKYGRFTKKLDEEETFRLCWRTAGKYYRAASETHSTAFALRNLNMKCFLGAIFLLVVFASTGDFSAFLFTFIAVLAFLRQFVYFDGEWARNVYECFYAWYGDTKKTTGVD